MGTSSWDSFMGLSFDRSVDVATFLTFLTLVAGVMAWGVKTVKEWRRDATREAQDGALRLLLKILRERYEQSEGPVDLDTLRADFSSPGRRPERKAYCGREFHFKNDPHFEQAIYALQWEGKIDFAESDRVLWRTALDRRPRLRVNVAPDTAIRAFTAALEDDETREWDLERLARLAAGADPAGTKAALESAVAASSGNPTRLRKLLLVAELVSSR